MNLFFSSYTPYRLAININNMNKFNKMLLVVLLITSMFIASGNAVSVKHSAKKLTDENHRQLTRSTQQIPSTATSISSPAFLTKNHMSKPSSGTTSQTLSSSDILSQYILPNGSYFTHMTFDRKNSVLYAGASNRILQLNYNLSVLSQGNLTFKLNITNGMIQFLCIL